MGKNRKRRRGLGLPNHVESAEDDDRPTFKPVDPLASSSDRYPANHPGPSNFSRQNHMEIESLGGPSTVQTQSFYNTVYKGNVSKSSTIVSSTGSEC
jgi:hypothetical protein